MKGAGLLPFVRLFPEQGLDETRVFMVRRHPTLPDDDYGLMESFCADVTCHCRRVMLNVASRRRGGGRDEPGPEEPEDEAPLR